MDVWLRVAVLSIGGAAGVNARHWLGVWMHRHLPSSFPWPTLTINVTGSFAIGFLATLLTARSSHPNLRLLMIAGFLGGYTTFSAFSYEALALWENGMPGRAALYIAGSVGGGMLAAVLGVALARAWFVAPGAARVGDPAAAGGGTTVAARLVDPPIADSDSLL